MRSSVSRLGWMVSTAVATLSIVSLAGSAQAQSATYTFEEPNFTAPQVTPINNVAPNVNNGLPGLTASFTSDPTVGGIVVSTLGIGNGFDGIFQQFLSTTTPQTLTVTLSSAITRITFNYVLFALPERGFLSVSSIEGGDIFVPISSGTIPDTAFGTVDFTFSNPVTSFDIRGSGEDERPARYILDDLTVFGPQSAAPEPGPVTLILTGAFAVAGFRVRKRR